MTDGQQIEHYATTLVRISQTMRNRAMREDANVASEEHGFDLEAMDQYADKLTDAILALLATDRAAGVGEQVALVERLRKMGEPVHDRIWLHGIGSDGGEVTWSNEPDPSGEPEEAEWAVEYVLAAASPPAPADASDFSPHRWTEIVSNGLGANNAGCWRCGALSEVLARVLSLSGHDAKVIQGKANGEDHVWVQIGDTVYDPTVGQFQEPVSYQMDQVAPADASGEVREVLSAIVAQSYVGKPGSAATWSKWAHYPSGLFHRAVVALAQEPRP